LLTGTGNGESNSSWMPRADTGNLFRAQKQKVRNTKKLSEFTKAVNNHERGKTAVIRFCVFSAVPSKTGATTIFIISQLEENRTKRRKHTHTHTHTQNTIRTMRSPSGQLRDTTHTHTDRYRQRERRQRGRGRERERERETERTAGHKYLPQTTVSLPGQSSHAPS